MADATAEFFGELARRGHEPLLERTTGTFRFELVDGTRLDRWLVAVTKGDVTVSHKNGEADCVVRADRSLFERVASGEVNAMAATLRGEVVLEGNWTLLVQFQRLFPGPPSRKPRRAAGSARR